MRRFAKFATIAVDFHVVSHKYGKMGNKPHRIRYRRMAHVSFENILKNRGRRQLQPVFVMELTVSKD